jgi:L-threonylcarbamoyladenylate synthase
MIVSVRKAAELIKKGKVVAFPTETVYGLGADAKNVLAVKKTFDIKGRPSDNPLIVHISDLNQLTDLAFEIPDLFYKLAEKFWPGPLTFILNKHPSVPDVVTAGLDTVAIRMPNHPFALELIRFTGPLTAPSANKSGKPSPTKATHVIDDHGADLPVIDGGTSHIGLESTVLDLTLSPPVILRPGSISKGMIEEVIQIKLDLNSKSQIDKKSPGTRYSHYKPLASVSWFDKLPSHLDSNTYYITHNIESLIQADNLISFKSDYPAMARYLYDHFRRADHLGYSQILIELLPNESVHPLISPLKNRISKAISA